MVDDFAGFWLDKTANPAAESTDYEQQDYEDYRAMCYVRLGSRWAADDWPAEDRFMQGPCR
jgi:hypothetical protein